MNLNHTGENLNSPGFSLNIIPGIIYNKNAELFLHFLKTHGDEIKQLDSLEKPLITHWGEHIDILQECSKQDFHLPASSTDHNNFLWGLIWREQTIQWALENHIPLQFKAFNQDKNPPFFILQELIDRSSTTPGNGEPTWLEVGRLILESGVDVNQEDSQFFSPLMTAAMHGNNGWVELLLSFDASPLPNKTLNQTPEQMAKIHGHVQTAHLIESFFRAHQDQKNLLKEIPKATSSLSPLRRL